MIFIVGFILCFLTNIAVAMEDPIMAKIDPAVKHIIHKEFPCSFHNHLRIIDEIEKDNNKRPLLKKEKLFVFNGLADYLHSRGLEFLSKWRNDHVSPEEIRKACHLCIEDDWIIDAWEDDDIFFSIRVASMRLNYRFTLENFAFYTFFKPCFGYYSIAKGINNMFYEYDQKIETAKKSFRDFFPNTTLVENCKSQKGPVNDCSSVTASTKCPNIAEIVSQKKLIKSLSGKCLSPHISKKSLTVRGKK